MSEKAIKSCVTFLNGKQCNFSFELSAKLWINVTLNVRKALKCNYL